MHHSVFTLLVFSIYGSMGRECHKFYSRLSDLLSEKRNKVSSKRITKVSSRKLGKIKSLFRVIEIKNSLFT